MLWYTKVGTVQQISYEKVIKYCVIGFSSTPRTTVVGASSSWAAAATGTTLQRGTSAIGSAEERVDRYRDRFHCVNIISCLIPPLSWLSA